MKKIILLFIFNQATIICFSQAAGNASPAIEKNYLKKSKNQKTAAWIALGGGVGVSILGLNQINVAGSDKPINNTPWTVLFVTGAVSAFSSIHLFAVSKKNYKKAMTIAINTKQLHHFNKSNVHVVNYPALAIKINF